MAVFLGAGEHGLPGTFFKDYLMAGDGAYQYQKIPQIQGKIGLNV